MLAIKETLRKINTLDDNNVAIVVNLVDYLSDMQGKRESNADNPFRRIRENGAEHWISEDEIEEIVADVRRSRNAAGD